MTDRERRTAAAKFAETWKDRKGEKQDKPGFWYALLRDVFGIEKPETVIEFERPVTSVMTSKPNYIDAYIPSTRVLIEHKSRGVDLTKSYKLSDGSVKTPFQQAWHYGGYLGVTGFPRWIVTCNFREFRIHDMERPSADPQVLRLEDLADGWSQLSFLVDPTERNTRKETTISIEAGDRIDELYKAIRLRYKDPDSLRAKESLNALCVRLVFCFYAEDAQTFPKDSFYNYLQAHRSEGRWALIRLFQVLDRREEDRDPYLDDDLAAFPYVNGGLFADEDIEIPQLDEGIIDMILDAADFNWAQISPTIFGAIFESTLNEETRRKGGMHYTSIENIHKVIDPLFLDDLKVELAKIIGRPRSDPWRKRYLEGFKRRLASLRFLDPACGSGNFLTETYLSLRRLENAVIRELVSIVEGQMGFGDLGRDVLNVEVDIGQFYGIEIHDFAVKVAQTALWIAENQMLQETKQIADNIPLAFLPLTTAAHIVEGNALRMDWERVVPKSELSYIMGNPPFVGQPKGDQRTDMEIVFKTMKGYGSLDYVASWYMKATAFTKDTAIRTAFVSTNSITQGKQPAILWKELFQWGIQIHFAYRTFQWDSEAKAKAHVHCVIIGFGYGSVKKRYIFEGDQVIEAAHINGYLVNGPDIYVESRKKPICPVPNIIKGSSPVDGGNLLLSDEEKDVLMKKDPASSKCIRQFYGATEYLHNIRRWCLWLKDISPADINKSAFIKDRVAATRAFRLASSKAATRRFADYPTRFMEMRQPQTNYLLVPRHSLRNRRYIPFGFLGPDIICGDACSMIPDATLYHFGVLMSKIHMDWMRAVCGRLKSDYRYSNDIVYNNFPWPDPTPAQKAAIEKTAQAILDARALFPDSSLADLYDETAMSPELRRAHEQNDAAVMRAYGIRRTDPAWESEYERMVLLRERYLRLTEGREGR